MIPVSVSKLFEHHLPGKKSDGLLVSLGVILAAITPALAVLIGSIVDCLQPVAQNVDQTSQRFGWLVGDPIDVIAPTAAPLMQIAILLLVVLACILCAGACLFVFYRRAQGKAVEFEIQMFSRLREHSKRLARVRTLSSQQHALADALELHLPRMRVGLARWWRTYPRHAIQTVLCALVALLIDGQLALVAFVGTGVVYLTYRYLDRERRTNLPVVRERAQVTRKLLAGVCLRGPLLESIHDEHDINRRFTEQLDHYRRDAIRSQSATIWKSPLLLTWGGTLLVLFLFVVARRVLSPDVDLSLGGALAFVLCFVGGSISWGRFEKARRDLQGIESAAEELNEFLDLHVEETSPEGLRVVKAVQKSAKFEHVIVQDSRGRKLLDNVTLEVHPGQLVGVVATQPIQAHALVELMLGFGRPVSGRMMFDDQVITDLDPASVARCGHWVAPDGAIVTGTVKENILGTVKLEDPSQLDEAVRKAGLEEALQKLPDGMLTVISPDDDRLGPDVAFRLGLARANLRNHSVVVVEEPVLGRTDSGVEEATMKAIHALVSPNRICLVLPRRLRTLRECASVLVMQEDGAVDMATHGELLQRNELYRHLNYLNFNAFRNSSNSATP